MTTIRFLFLVELKMYLNKVGIFYSLEEFSE